MCNKFFFRVTKKKKSEKIDKNEFVKEENLLKLQYILVPPRQCTLPIMKLYSRQWSRFANDGDKIWSLFARKFIEMYIVYVKYTNEMSNWIVHRSLFEHFTLSVSSLLVHRSNIHSIANNFNCPTNATHTSHLIFEERLDGQSNKLLVKL